MPAVAMIMQFRAFLVFGLLIGCSACANEGASGQAAPSAATAAAVPQATASAAASTTAAAPSASASAAAEDPCKKHGLTLGGSGTKAEPCKYETDVLTAVRPGTLDEQGAAFAVTNPWDEEVNRLGAAVYYYDQDGKQLMVKVNGKVARAARLDAEQVKIPGGKKPTTLTLGPAKKDLPAEVATVELQILGFGWDDGAGNTAYFASTTPFRQNRAINGGDGPTGIAACDAYRELLESCPKMMPDALKAMRKSLRDYNNAAPEIQKKLADGLEKGCVDGTAAAKGKCKPQ